MSIWCRYHGHTTMFWSKMDQIVLMTPRRWPPVEQERARRHTEHRHIFRNSRGWKRHPDGHMYKTCILEYIYEKILHKTHKHYVGIKEIEFLKLSPSDPGVLLSPQGLLSICGVPQGSIIGSISFPYLCSLWVLSYKKHPISHLYLR